MDYSNRWVYMNYLLSDYMWMIIVHKIYQDIHVSVTLVKLLVSGDFYNETYSIFQNLEGSLRSEVKFSSRGHYFTKTNSR